VIIRVIDTFVDYQHYQFTFDLRPGQLNLSSKYEPAGRLALGHRAT